MNVGIKIFGTANVQQYLNVTPRINRLRAFQRAGLRVEQNARMKAPYRTGHLRRNITTEATVNQAEIGVSLDVVPYAWYQEAGTSKMPAHPYLRPGLESSRKEIAAVFIDEINKATRSKKK